MTTLIVVSGLPGSGKTTLAQALTRALQTTYLRVDSVETPLVLAGIEVGPLGYSIVMEVARSNLLLGRDVVVDLVNPLPVTRELWWRLAEEVGAGCVMLECALPDRTEHRRRVEQRAPDIAGHRVPTWSEVDDHIYRPWDEQRDGPRTLIDTTDRDAALAAALAVVGESRAQR